MKFIMDAKVDDFFNEINEIAPPKQTPNDEGGKAFLLVFVHYILTTRKSFCFLLVWKECQDELTGYSYYWNIETDEVTWTVPKEFKDKNKQNVMKKDIPFVPKENPKISPPETLKIYSVQEDSGNVVKTVNKPQKKPYKPSSDSEEE